MRRGGVFSPLVGRLRNPLAKACCSQLDRIGPRVDESRSSLGDESSHQSSSERVVATEEEEVVSTLKK